MNKTGFIIFFSIVVILLGLLNYYIIRRGLSVLEGYPNARIIWTVLVVIFASSFIVGRFAERIALNSFTTALIWIGSFWLGIMAYLVLQLLLVDIIRLADKLFHFLPDILFIYPGKTKKILAVLMATITFITVVAGFINTWFPKVKHLELVVNKNAGTLSELNIVAFSDVHLGTVIEKKHLKIIVDKVNALNPDIILIPGDLIDEDIAPVIKNNVGEILVQLRSKYGVFACTGNHEYIGGVDKAKKYLHEHHIKLLDDTVLLIDNSFYIAGREDISMKQFKNRQRKSLSQILSGIDLSLPVILLDHQPFNLNDAMEAGVDLQLSGHTHHGQLWPFNFITEAIYEISAGYLLKGNTHYYVLSGIGGWGPPLRTNSRPEIVHISLRFKNY